MMPSIKNIFFLCIFLTASTSYADLAFKRKIIEKCDEAKAEIGRMEQSRQIEAIQDLKLILKLKLNQNGSKAPDFSSNKISSLNAPFDELRGDDIWQAFQPDRDIKAKQCALEILKSLSPFSLDALPEMIELTQEATLPQETKNILFENIQSITLDAVNDDRFYIPPSTIESVIDLLSTPAAYFAQNVLIEMHKQSVPLLFKELRKPDVTSRDIISETLLKIDSSGYINGPEALKLLASSDDGLRKRGIVMLSSLEEYYSFSLPAIIETLDDISDEIRDTTFSSLDRIFSNLKTVPKIVLQENSIHILFRKLLSSEAAERKIIVKGLNKLLTLTSDFENKIIKIFPSVGPDIKADLLRILPGSTLTPQFKDFLFKSLKDPNNTVKLTALEIINDVKADNKASMQALLKLAQDPDHDTRSGAHALILKVGKPIYGELLKTFSQSSIPEKMYLFELVVKSGATDKQITNFFQGYINNAECTQKAKMIALAPNLTQQFRKDVITQLGICMKDPEGNHEILHDALLSLKPFTQDEQKNISNLLLADSTSYKSLILSLKDYLEFGITKDNLITITKKLLKSDSKAVKFRVLSFLNSLQEPLPLLPEIIEVKNTSEDDELLANEAILAISKLDRNALDLKSFYKQELENEKSQWVDKYIDKIPTDLAIQVIQEALNELPISEKYLACRLAAKLGSKAHQLLPQIKPFIESADQNLRYAATIALVKIDPSDPQALPAFRALLLRDYSKLLSQETFSRSIEPFFAQIKSTSISMVERDIIKRLEKNIK